LLAVAIQICVSFGHAHRVDSFRQAAFAPQTAAGIHGRSTVDRSDPASKPIGLAFEYCAICVVIKMGTSIVPAVAPDSDVPVVVGEVRFLYHAEAATWTFGHLLFQARAPPFA
jgi:hypothetical protein